MDKAKTVTLNVKVDEYANRVLGVVKEKYGLRDKGEAIAKFAEMYGDEYVGREIREEIVKEMLEACDKHIKKHGFRKRTIDELTRKLEAQ
jgi:hypothetical protein